MEHEIALRLERVSTVQKVSEVLQVADHYYVLATSILADHETRVLKSGETFAIFDSYGDAQPMTHAESGVFHRGTRYLSAYELSIHDDERPLLLNSTLRDDNSLLKVDLTNRDLQVRRFTKAGEPASVQFLKGTLHLHREKFLFDSRCLERIELANFGTNDFQSEFSICLAADFRDIFEVRGTKRLRQGQVEAPQRLGDQIVFRYHGLDGVIRRTTFRLLGAEYCFDGKRARFTVQVPARGTCSFETELLFSEEQAEEQGKREASMPLISYKKGLHQVVAQHSFIREKYCKVGSSNERFDNWMRRSTDDLVMMTTETEQGRLYPYAGIPWFCTPFGRDGILSAMECMWANPHLGKGVLQYLAQMQATEHETERDAQPGKILHEARFGEMAALGEVPFGRYYGSVDSTPLFVALGGMYYSRTGDLETVRLLWPAFERALQWIDEFGDLDGDGFIEYQRQSPRGLAQQGWKDSNDSVFHADGSDAEGPIALCEVQAYVYLARIEAAKLADALGDPVLAAELRNRAADLKERFDKAFWLEDLETYALALDCDKRPCRVRTSNAGQCLFTGIALVDRVPRLVKTLMAPESFTGWGIRTVASDAIRYNPMSYHNGSVWPHDTALIAWGLAKCGYKDEVERIFNGLFRAATYMSQMRMPEVFCGFPKRDGEAPTLYPQACAPQAWAAASIYMLIQSMLGLEVDAVAGQVRLLHPRLPEAIENLRIGALTLPDGTVDLSIQNYFSDVSVQIARRGTTASVLVEK